MITNRHREKVNLNTSDELFAYYSSGQVTSLGYWPTLTDTEVMDDVLIPFPPASGMLPENDCAYTHYNHQTASGSYYAYTSSVNPLALYVGNVTGRLVWYSKFQVPKPTLHKDLVANAKLRALGSIDASVGQFGEDLAELGKTLRYIKNPLKSLATIGKEFRNSKRKIVSKAGTRGDPKRIAKAVSDLWLEYRFAATPLVKSVDKALELFGQRPCEDSISIARGSDEEAATDSNVSSSPDNPAVFFEWHSHIEVTARAKVRYKITNPSSGLAKTLGVRGRDLPEVFWAVMPYSFLVDRMVDVSAGLAAVRGLTTPGLVILGSSSSVRELWSKKTKLDHIAPQGYNYYDCTNSNVVDEEIFTYSREYWAPAFSDTVPVPNWHGLIDTAKEVADVAALVLQRWK